MDRVSNGSLAVSSTGVKRGLGIKAMRISNQNERHLCIFTLLAFSHAFE